MCDCREVRANARDPDAPDPHGAGRPLAAVAAILVAVTALASCADTGDRAAPEATNIAAAPTVTEATASAPKYLDVSGEGPARLDPAIPQYAADPAPGILISRKTTQQSPDGTAGCTLGPAVTVGGRAAFLTAGHCSEGGTPQYASTGPGATDILALGPAVQSLDESDGPKNTNRVFDDRALIFTPRAAGDSLLGQTWPVVGGLSVDDTRRLPVRTPICIDGAYSGVRCGKLITATGDRLRFDHVTRDGDSGAPVFVVVRGKATVIGIHRGVDPANGAVGEATFIEPALLSLGAQLVTAN